MTQFTFLKSSKPRIGGSIESLSSSRKKKSGCGCFISGCLTFFLLTTLLLAGGGWYIYTLDKKEPIGLATTYIIKYNSVRNKLINDVKQNPLLPEDEKIAFVKLYEYLLSQYSVKTKKEQSIIKENLGSLTKQLIKNPDLFATEPMPKEFYILFNKFIKPSLN